MRSCQPSLTLHPAQLFSRFPTSTQEWTSGVILQDGWVPLLSRAAPSSQVLSGSVSEQPREPCIWGFMERIAVFSPSSERLSRRACWGGQINKRFTKQSVIMSQRRKETLSWGGSTATIKNGLFNFDTALKAWCTLNRLNCASAQLSWSKATSICVWKDWIYTQNAI